ncbi:Uncharacterized protein HZ326_0958 [Fusarium oxysporum f. sp. albedinis]|nr:Uncharacterized protein HZ326_0958 [Fusarium oxysporum f. sp. albedinis]
MPSHGKSNKRNENWHQVVGILVCDNIPLFQLAILQSSVLFALHSLYRGLDNSRATMGSPKKEVEQTESNRQFGENCNTPTR